MWLEDPCGTNLDGPDEAREELRLRARLAISAGLRAGFDCRHSRVRLRDQDAAVLFEGTLAEAASCDLDALDQLMIPSNSAAIAEAQRLRARAASLRIRAMAQAARLEHLRMALAEQRQISDRLLAQRHCAGVVVTA